MKNHRLHILLIVALLFAATLSISQTALGQDATIPTRTPTPGAGPTNTPDNPPPPTNTPDNPPPPQATATATAVPVNTATATPIPAEQAEICIDPPTITVRVETIVREGPGDDYPEIEVLAVGEVRSMLGRARYAEWFYIELDDQGNTGWVPDENVDEQGDTNVPIEPAPPINGETPTPGVPWNPTPQPGCLTPTPTATPTHTPTATATATATTVATATATATATPTAEPIGSNTTAGDESAGTGNGEEAVSEVADSAIPTAEPLETDQASGGALSFLPFVGLALLAAALFLVFYFRSRGAGGGTPAA